MFHRVALATFWGLRNNAPAFLAFHEPLRRGFPFAQFAKISTSKLGVEGHRPLVFLRPNDSAFKNHTRILASDHSQENFMKKFIKHPQSVVDEMLEGFAVLSAASRVYPDTKSPSTVRSRSFRAAAAVTSPRTQDKLASECSAPPWRRESSRDADSRHAFTSPLLHVGRSLLRNA